MVHVSGAFVNQFVENFGVRPSNLEHVAEDAVALYSRKAYAREASQIKLVG